MARNKRDDFALLFLAHELLISGEVWLFSDDGVQNLQQN